jgi:hypothetical protein
VSFSGRRTDDLVRIATAGAGFRLEASGRPTADLVEIASASSDWGVQLVFTGMGDRPTDELVAIAEAGQGNVQFEG